MTTTSSISRHLDIIRCPACLGELSVAPDDLGCGKCGKRFPVDGGFPNFAPEIPRQSGTSLGQRQMEAPRAVAHYESVARVNYVRWMGKTHFTSFSPSDEQRYLTASVAPPGNTKILDLACGTGLATRVLAARFGPDRVLGLDVSFAMLERARPAVPECVLVRGSAMQLPMAEASLGAVNCWDALQAIPAPREAIAEIGRCLAPGGTFTCFTFSRARGPYRWVQDLLARGVGSKIFRLEQLSTWLEDAGMKLVDHSGPGQILLFTAVRT